MYVCMILCLKEAFFLFRPLMYLFWGKYILGWNQILDLLDCHRRVFPRWTQFWSEFQDFDISKNSKYSVPDVCSYFFPWRSLMYWPSPLFWWVSHSHMFNRSLCNLFGKLVISHILLKQPEINPQMKNVDLFHLWVNFLAIWTEYEIWPIFQQGYRAIY